MSYEWMRVLRNSWRWRWAISSSLAGHHPFLPSALTAAAASPPPPLGRCGFGSVDNSYRCLETVVMGSQSTEVEWPANRVRDTFISYFEDKKHVNWKSSPVVPLNDPTLLFCNAGSIPLPSLLHTPTPTPHLLLFFYNSAYSVFCLKIVFCYLIYRSTDESALVLHPVIISD